MTDNITQDIINDLAIQLANKTVEAAEYKARFGQTNSDLDHTQQQLAEFQQVLDANPDLAALFEEEKAKIQGGQQ